LDDAFVNFRIRISEVYTQFNYLNVSEKMEDFEKEKFIAYRNGQVNHEELKYAFYFLSKCLHKHHNQKVIIFLDEYDSPIHDAYTVSEPNKPFHPLMLDFMSAFISATFKGNNFLARGMITGILYISHNNMFSGANNIPTYGIMDNEYRSAHGFTEDEIKTQLLLAADLSDSVDFNEVKHWYNGYRIGDEKGPDIYNPWSIIRCLSRNKIESYWTASGDINLISHALIRSESETFNDFKALLSGATIEREIDKRTFFVDLSEDPVAFWTLLLYSGYLKVTGQKAISGNQLCQLTLPNEETRSACDDMVKRWLRQDLKYHQFDALQTSLIEARLADFADELSKYLHVTSSFDFGDDSHSNKENLYHVMMCGLMASTRSTHFFYSNREAGRGRPDLVLIPKSPNNRNLPAIMLEFKSLGKGGQQLAKSKRHGMIEHQLAEEARIALGQILEESYSSMFDQYDYIAEICFIGISFSGKQFKMECREHVPFRKELLKCKSIEELDVWIESKAKDSEISRKRKKESEINIVSSSSSSSSGFFAVPPEEGKSEEPPMKRSKGEDISRPNVMEH
jgi:hypothetical protein